MIISRIKSSTTNDWTYAVSTIRGDTQTNALVYASNERVCPITYQAIPLTGLQDINADWGVLDVKDLVLRESENTAFLTTVANSFMVVDIGYTIKIRQLTITGVSITINGLEVAATNGYADAAYEQIVSFNNYLYNSFRNSDGAAVTAQSINMPLTHKYRIRVNLTSDIGREIIIYQAYTDDSQIIRDVIGNQNIYPVNYDCNMNHLAAYQIAANMQRARVYNLMQTLLADKTPYISR